MIQLRNETHEFVSSPLLIDKRGKDTISLARPCAPYQYLYVKQSGLISYRDCAERGSSFVMKVFEESVYGDRHICACAIQSCQNRTFLNVDINGELILHKEEIILHCIMIDENPIFQLPKIDVPTTSISPHHIGRFVAEGYLHLPNIVPETKTRACIKMLNHFLGRPGSLVPGGTQGQDFGKFTGGITHREEIQRLFDGPVCTVVEWLLGCAGSCDKSNLNAQIAFRYPEITEEMEIDETGSCDGTF